MTYIEKYMHALALYLEKTCFCKYPCTNEMIIRAIKAKGVDCCVSPHMVNCFGEPVVQLSVREWTIYIDEEIYAVSQLEPGKVYCPPM